MTITVAIHSSKGGTGKTSIAVNLAVAFASEGLDTCLIDMDLRGPSLCTIFKQTPRFWINDFLSGKCTINDTLNDMKKKVKSSGHLYLSYSNPDITQIRELVGKDRAWQASALKALMNVKKDLAQKDIDIIMIDTSPGMEYESINAVAASDIVLVVQNDTDACNYCTEQLINGVYSLLDKKYAIIDNMCHFNCLENIENSRYGAAIIASIPCMCDVPMRSKKEILVLTDPEHQFSKSILRIKHWIEKMQ